MSGKLAIDTIAPIAITNFTRKENMLPYSKPCRHTGHGARTPHCKEASPAKWREMSGKSYDADSRFIPPSTLSPAGGSKTVPGRLRKEGTRRGTAKKISLPQRIALFPHIGTCLPVGLLRQDPVVRLKMELEECPQYLHTYRLFSSPS